MTNKSINYKKQKNLIKLIQKEEENQCLTSTKKSNIKKKQFIMGLLSLMELN